MASGPGMLNMKSEDQRLGDGFFTGGMRAASSRGFSIAEITVVVIILGLLMLLVVPRLTKAAQADQEQTLRDHLGMLRTQILIYQAQHGGVAPGYPGGNTAMMPTHQAFVAQMTRFTNQAGDTSNAPSEEFRFGPYLSGVPKNPLTKKKHIRFMKPTEQIPTATGDQGWVYQPATGTIAANTSGTDIRGAKYTDY